METSTLSPHASEERINPIVKLYYTKQEAAQMLSLSVRMIDYMIQRGVLRVRRVGRRVLISRKALLQFAQGDHSGRVQ